MTLGVFRGLALIALFNGAVIGSHAAVANDDIHVTGKLVDVSPQPGCGYLYFGSPATYKLIKGPASLVGKQITVVVPCIELPLPKGNVRSFVVGDIHDLSITRVNLYKIELPAELPNASWYYLKAASSQE